MVPHLAGKIDKILSEMGLYGSVWVDIEGIRSHMGYKGSDIGKRDLVCYIILNLGLDRIMVFPENGFWQNESNMPAIQVELGGEKA